MSLIFNEFTKLFIEAQRPILLVGHGVELAEAIQHLKRLIEIYPIPVVWSQGGINVLPSDHLLNIGKVGTKGSRAGNFAVQNADLVVSIGSRLSVSTTGQDYKNFAREAKLVVVDIDYYEHHKNTVKVDLFIHLDAQNFLQWILSTIQVWNNLKFHPEWVAKCQHWKKIFPVYSKTYAKSEQVNLYYFIEELSKQLRQGDTVVADAGSAVFVTSQGLRFGETNRVILSSAQAEMGFTLPACIGVSCANNHGEVIGITGDGSLQMNIQELQTIKHHELPVKLFVWNNNGYLSMKNTQKAFFGRYSCADPSSGVSFPNLREIAYAYGIYYMLIPNSKSAAKIIELALMHKGAVICEVMCLHEQEILTIKSKKVGDKFVSMPLEDMSPYIPRKLFKTEMLIKPLEASLLCA